MGRGLVSGRARGRTAQAPNNGVRSSARVKKYPQLLEYMKAPSLLVSLSCATGQQGHWRMLESKIKENLNRHRQVVEDLHRISPRVGARIVGRTEHIPTSHAGPQYEGQSPMKDGTSGQSVSFPKSSDRVIPRESPLRHSAPSRDTDDQDANGTSTSPSKYPSPMANAYATTGKYISSWKDPGNPWLQAMETRDRMNGTNDDSSPRKQGLRSQIVLMADDIERKQAQINELQQQVAALSANRIQDLSSVEDAQALNNKLMAAQLELSSKTDLCNRLQEWLDDAQSRNQGFHQDHSVQARKNEELQHALRIRDDELAGALSEIERLRSQVHELEGRLTHEGDSWRAQLQTVRNDLVAKDTELMEARSTQLRSEAQTNASKVALDDELRMVRNAMESLTKERNDLLSQVSLSRERQARLEGELRKLREEHDNLTRQQNAESNAMLVKLRKAEGDREQLQNALGRAETELHTKTSQMSIQSEETVAQLQRSLSEALSQRDLYEQEVSSFRSELQMVRNRAEDAERKLGDLESTLSVKSVEIDELRQYKFRYQDVKSRLDNMTGSAQAHAKDHEKLEVITAKHAREIQTLKENHRSREVDLNLKIQEAKSASVSAARHSDHLQERLNSANEELEESRAHNADLLKSLERRKVSEASMAVMKAEYETTIAELRRNFDSTANSRQALEQELADLRLTLQSSREETSYMKEELGDEREKSRKMVAELRQHIAVLQKEASEDKNMRDEYARLRDRYENEVAALQGQVNNLDQKLRETQGVCDTSRVEMEELSQQARNDKDVLETSLHNLEKTHEETLEYYESQLETSRAELVSLRAELDREKNENSDMKEESHAEISRLVNEVSQLEETLASTEGELAKESQGRVRAEDLMLELKETTIRKLKERDSVESQLKQEIGTLKESQISLKKTLDIRQETNARLEGDVSKLGERLSELTTTLGEKAERVRYLEQSMADMSESYSKEVKDKDAGLERLEKLVESLEDALRKKESKLIELERDYNLRISDAESRREVIIAQSRADFERRHHDSENRFRTEVQEANVRAERARLDQEESERRCREVLTAQENRVDEVEAMLAAAREEVTRLQENLDVLRQLRDTDMDFARTEESKVRTLEKEVEELRSENHNVRASLAAEEAKVSAADKRLDARIEEISSLTSQYNKARTSALDLEKQCARLKVELDVSKDLKYQIEDLNRRLDARGEVCASLEEETKATAEQLDEERLKRKDCERVLETQKREHQADLEMLRETLASEESRVNYLKQQLDTRSEEVMGLRHECDSLRSAAASREKVCERLKSELSNVTDECTKLKTEDLPGAMKLIEEFRALVQDQEVNLVRATSVSPVPGGRPESPTPSLQSSQGELSTKDESKRTPVLKKLFSKRDASKTSEGAVEPSFHNALAEEVKELRDKNFRLAQSLHDSMAKLSAATAQNGVKPDDASVCDKIDAESQTTEPREPEYAAITMIRKSEENEVADNGGGLSLKELRDFNQDLTRRVDSLVKELEDKNVRIRNLLEEKTTLQAAVIRLEESGMASNGDADAMHESMTTMEAHVAQLTNELREHKRQADRFEVIQGLVSSYLDLHNTSGEDFERGQDLVEDLERLLDQCDRTTTDLIVRNNELTIDLASAREDQELAERKLRELHTKYSEAEVSASQLKEHEGRMREYINDISKLERRCSEKDSEIGNLNSIVDDLKASLETTRALVTTQEGLMKKSEEEAAKLKQDWNSMVDKIAALETELDNAAGRLGALGTLQEQVANLLAECGQTTIDEVVAAFGDFQVRLERAENALVDQDRIIEELTRQLHEASMQSPDEDLMDCLVKIRERVRERVGQGHTGDVGYLRILNSLDVGGSPFGHSILAPDGGSPRSTKSSSPKSPGSPPLVTKLKEELANAEERISNLEKDLISARAQLDTEREIKEHQVSEAERSLGDLRALLTSDRDSNKSALYTTADTSFHSANLGSPSLDSSNPNGTTRSRSEVEAEVQHLRLVVKDLQKKLNQRSPSMESQHSEESLRKSIQNLEDQVKAKELMAQEISSSSQHLVADMDTKLKRVQARLRDKEFEITELKSSLNETRTEMEELRKSTVSNRGNAMEADGEDFEGSQVGDSAEIERLRLELVEERSMKSTTVLQKRVELLQEENSRCEQRIKETRALYDDLEREYTLLKKTFTSTSTELAMLKSAGLASSEKTDDRLNVSQNSLELSAIQGEGLNGHARDHLAELLMSVSSDAEHMSAQLEAIETENNCMELLVHRMKAQLDEVTRERNEAMSKKEDTSGWKKEIDDMKARIEDLQYELGNKEELLAHVTKQCSKFQRIVADQNEEISKSHQYEQDYRRKINSLQVSVKETEQRAESTQLEMHQQYVALRMKQMTHEIRHGLDLMARGARFSKVSFAKAKVQERWCFLSKDANGEFAEIRWTRKANDKPSKAGAAPVSAIQGVYYGQRTPTFLRCKQSSSLKQWRCFSIRFQNRTLDLYTEDTRLVHSWLMGLYHLLQRQGLRVYCCGTPSSNLTKGRLLWNLAVMRARHISHKDGRGKYGSIVAGAVKGVRFTEDSTTTSVAGDSD